MVEKIYVDSYYNTSVEFTLEGGVKKVYLLNSNLTSHQIGVDILQRIKSGLFVNFSGSEGFFGIDYSRVVNFGVSKLPEDNFKEMVTTYYS